MKICLITSGSLNEFWQDKLDSIKRPDVLIFGFSGLGLVSYEKELNGETEFFQDLAKLSKQMGNVIISGCDTDVYGAFRHSGVIADRGKILGVSDMVHTIDDGEFTSGGGYRVYETSAGKIGLIIAEDLYFPEVSKMLSLCESDIIVSIFRKIDSSMPEIMLRANAFASGVPMCMCAKNYGQIAGIKGEILIASSKQIIEKEIKTEKDFHLVSYKRRGIFRDKKTVY